MLLVKIPNTKTKIHRSFTIDGRFFEIVEKYRALRPKNVTTDRFMLGYRKGKCINQPIGINTVGAMPQRIAKYLNLPNTNLYTGHSFRRSSATLLANSGANITTIKQHGGWKSTSVAEGYIENSIGNKRRISDLIVKSIDINPSESNASPDCNNNSNEQQSDTLQVNIDSDSDNDFDQQSTHMLERNTNADHIEKQSSQTLQVNYIDPTFDTDFDQQQSSHTLQVNTNVDFLEESNEQLPQVIQTNKNSNSDNKPSKIMKLDRNCRIPNGTKIFNLHHCNVTIN